ncbi:MAG: helix-turn-helix transcriptional regulator [Gemmatimonadota bacterium]
MDHPSHSPFALFPPPYREFIPLEPSETFPRDRRVLRGTALIWTLDRDDDPYLLRRASARPAGLPLMVVLPPAGELVACRDRVLAVAEEARPQTILPHQPRMEPEEMMCLLRREPGNLPQEFTDYLRWRGVTLDQETRRIVRRTVELSAELRTLQALARALYLSRRALGRRFQQRGLPVPSHWLQVCRLLRATLRMQNSSSSVFEVAFSLGYPDGFTLSNQMERLVGVRPSEARERLGWEWFVEAWLQTERDAGGLDVPLADEGGDVPGSGEAGTNPGGNGESDADMGEFDETPGADGGADERSEAA